MKIKTRDVNKIKISARVSRYQKGKTNLDLLKQEIVSGCGISWTICKSAPRPRHVTMPAPHHSAFLQVRCQISESAINTLLAEI